MPSKKIIFHIGTTKTGTTSIQHSLINNQAYLFDKFSIHVPISNRLEKKIKLKERGEKDFIGGGNFEKKVIGSFREGDFVTAHNLLSAMFRTASQKEALTTIYSAEVLLGLGESKKACEILGETSRQYFDDVQIICCVRPPLDHASSQYSESVKRRRQTKSFNDCLNDVCLDVGSKLYNFSQVFGADNISVMPYEDPEKRSLVKRFFRLVDERLLDDTTFFGKIESMQHFNRSFSPLECEAARLLNKFLRNFLLDRVTFVEAYNSYLSKYKKDSLRQYHYVSESSLKSFEELNEESLSVVNQIGGTSIPIFSSRYREGVTTANQAFSQEEEMKIQEVTWRLLQELNIPFEA